MLTITWLEECSTEQALARSLVEANNQTLDLDCAELAAAINREPTEKMKAIRRDLDRAMKLKSVLLDRYASHVRTHGCKCCRESAISG